MVKIQNLYFYHTAMLRVREPLVFYYQDVIYIQLNNFYQNSCLLFDQIVKLGSLWKINGLELLFALEELHHLFFFQKMFQSLLKNQKTSNILSFFYFHEVSLNFFNNWLNIVFFLFKIRLKNLMRRITKVLRIKSCVNRLWWSSSWFKVRPFWSFKSTRFNHLCYFSLINKIFISLSLNFSLYSLIHKLFGQFLWTPTFKIKISINLWKL